MKNIPIIALILLLAASPAWARKWPEPALPPVMSNFDRYMMDPAHAHDYSYIIHEKPAPMPKRRAGYSYYPNQRVLPNAPYNPRRPLVLHPYGMPSR